MAGDLLLIGPIRIAVITDYSIQRTLICFSRPSESTAPDDSGIREEFSSSSTLTVKTVYPTFGEHLFFTI